MIASKRCYFFIPKTHLNGAVWIQKETLLSDVRYKIVPLGPGAAAFTSPAPIVVRTFVCGLKEYSWLFRMKKYSCSSSWKNMLCSEPVIAGYAPRVRAASPAVVPVTSFVVPELPSCQIIFLRKRKPLIYSLNYPYNDCTKSERSEVISKLISISRNVVSQHAVLNLTL